MSSLERLENANQLNYKAPIGKSPLAYKFQEV